MSTKLTLSIIGPGKVGSTLAYLAHQSQHYKVVIGSRDIIKAKALTKDIKIELTVTDNQTAAGMGDIILLTVPDDAIYSTCQQLAQTFKKGAIVAHCSGALNSDELLSAQTQHDVHIASLHPLQTFPSFKDSVHRLSNSDCYYEGDHAAKQTIQQLITHLGMRPIEIQKQAKILYHATAVVACNYLSALIDAALEIGEAADLERTTLWSSLEPLVTSTLDNIKHRGTQNALTGPIARGDINTIQQHLQALHALPSEQAERLGALYSSLGIQAAYLAKKKGSINSIAEKKLQELLIAPSPHAKNTDTET